MGMTPVHKAVFDHVTLTVDGNYFLECHFSGCTLIYTGGDVEFMDCTFGDPCALKFHGDAFRTIQYLHSWGDKLSPDFAKEMGFKPKDTAD